MNENGDDAAEVSREMPSIHVLLVDDHAVVRRALRVLLDRESHRRITAGRKVVVLTLVAALQYIDKSRSQV